MSFKDNNSTLLYTALDNFMTVHVYEIIWTGPEVTDDSRSTIS